MQFSITKTIKWHMGHRVPNHKSKCKSNHGHTYFLEAEVVGVLQDRYGESDEGMVMDFSDVKDILVSRIYDTLDHGCMMWREDPLADALNQDPHTKLVIVPFIPTAENIARWCYDQITDAIYQQDARWLKSVSVWETPTSKASYPASTEKPTG